MRSRLLATLLTVLPLAACSSGGGVDPLSDVANLGAKNPLIPNQVAGGNADDPALRRGTDRAEGAGDPVTTAEAEALRVERVRQAAAMWSNAERTNDAEEAAELYAEIAEEFPEYARAAEARYRAGVMSFRRGEWFESFESLRAYMQIAPVNPHLKDIERMVFVGGQRLLAENREGVFSVFRSDDGAVAMLGYVPQAFPAGLYADDALYVLGRHYQGAREPDIAALSYKQLLLSYPESEWVYMTRLALGDTYLERDQGEPYHAGFVDRDPREPLPRAEAAPFMGPVKSGPELALEQFEAFTAAVEADPRRRVEYAQHLQYARGRASELRRTLAAKERRTAAFYRAQGDTQAATIYEQAAARWLAAPARPAPATWVPGGPLADPPPAPGTTIDWPTAPAPAPGLPVTHDPATHGVPPIDPTTGLPWGEAPAPGAPGGDVPPPGA